MLKKILLVRKNRFRRIHAYREIPGNYTNKVLIIEYVIIEYNYVN